MSWNDCSVWAQAQLIAYSQLRDYEEFDEKLQFAKVRI